MTTTAPSPAPTTTDVLAALSSLLRASRSVARQQQAHLGASGTSLAILKALSDPTALDRPGDLAQATGVAPSVVSRALARLEEDGLVVRHPDPSDARACHMALTQEGRAELTAVQDQYAALLGDALAELSPEDLQRLPGLLATLERSIRRAGDRLAGPRHHPHLETLTLESR